MVYHRPVVRQAERERRVTTLAPYIDAREGTTRWFVGAAHGTIPAPDPCERRPPFTCRGPMQLLALQRHLHGAGSISGLFGRASEAARVECGFSRAVMLGVEDGLLTAKLMPALDDPASDALRRQLLAAPVRLVPGTIEAEFIRLAEGGRSSLIDGPSLLRSLHGLEQLAIGAVIPETRVLALLVADRPGPAVGFDDRALLQGFAQLVACSLERVVLRQRLAELAAEVRYLTVSTGALVGEAIGGEIALPVDNGAGLVFAGGPAFRARAPEHVPDLFTRRELTIVRLLIAGRSNREIAETLQLSPDTVKKYMSRVMRKVGAANRADAAVRCLQAFESGVRGRSAPPQTDVYT